MKITCFPLLLLFSSSFAQNHSAGMVIAYDPGYTECLSDSMRSEIKQHLAENILLLKNAGRIPQHYTSAPVLFGWPLRLRTGLVDYGYHSIAAQVDHDPAFPFQLKDYNCGTRTYDTPSGYNHQGTDYFLWPFMWNKMDSGDVEIVAAASGTIIYKSDGNFDRSCSGNNNNWNAVYIQHANGSVAWYGHMKKYSLTSKLVGQTVAQGEFLGKVGSSGNSSGPHLHLEVYDSAGVLNDPYQGPCNNFNNNSWWISQRPYMDAAINHIATNFAPPVFNQCSNEDIKNERDYFSNTDTVFLMTYYRFLAVNDSVLVNIYRPNSSLWSSWWWVNTSNTYVAAYIYWWMVAGTGEPSGQWRFEAVYKNQSYAHDFWIGPAGINEGTLAYTACVYPNPSEGEFTVSVNAPSIDFSNGKVELRIRDILGKELFKKELNTASTRISKAGLPPGIYFYTVHSGAGKIAAGKFMIQ